jgi:hypothetical protein
MIRRGLVAGLLAVVTGCYSGTRPPLIGANAPDFNVKDSDRAVTLSAFRGKRNIWVTGSPPVRAGNAVFDPDAGAAERQGNGGVGGEYRRRRGGGPVDWNSPDVTQYLTSL